jgi:hypothetical protein
LTPRGEAGAFCIMAQAKKNDTGKTKNHGGGHRTKVTPELIDKFLTILSDNGGIVVDAAKDVGVARKNLYDKRESDPLFRKRWNQAVDRGIEILEDEAKRRASEGTEEPVFYMGRIVGTVRRKSDYLMGLLLKGHRPRYRKESEGSFSVDFSGLAQLFEGIDTGAIRRLLDALRNGNRKKGASKVASRNSGASNNKRSTSRL